MQGDLDWTMLIDLNQDKCSLLNNDASEIDPIYMNGKWSDANLFVLDTF